MKEVIFNTHDLVLLMTAWLCVLFAVLLLTVKREKRQSNMLLAFFLLQQAAIPLDILVLFGEKFHDIALGWSPNLFYVFGFGYWLEAPFLLWYTRSLVYKDYQLTRRDLWYLLPFVAYLIYQILFYYRLEFAAKLQLQQEYDLFLAPHYMNYVTLFREVFRAALGVICLIEIQRYRKHLRTNYSDIEQIDLSWLRLLVIGFLGIRAWAVVVVFSVLLSVSFGVNADFETMGLVGNYTTFLLVSMLIFFGLSQSPVCEGIETKAEEDAKDPALKDKFDQRLVDQLVAYMETEKPYLLPALTLEKLSQQSRIQMRVLSNIINRQFECNFFEFINNYRVDEAKRLLADVSQKDKSMLDVMMDVGFNSKATFNTLFKKKVGMTPSEYRKSMLAQPLN